MSTKSGECPHGHPVKKVQVLECDGRLWTCEQRPDACSICREAISAGASSTLERYIEGAKEDRPHA